MKMLSNKIKCLCKKKLNIFTKILVQQFVVQFVILVVSPNKGLSTDSSNELFGIFTILKF
ncbi:hypothetical protein BpHYR1_031076 [Brachionus plicatilis]|uniref:Uncharacterized protein n=1 Tax=Brachionus plicatilis TaxID=10195 RepID=A0A3M7RX95_BRAPC|nr:hypothetical protein BpHYR1_031076 [Brachionus plicatilis]